MQGIGAALLLPGSLAIIVAVSPDRAQQARALGIWAAISSFALPAGPLLGGLLITADGWRTVFLINLPVVAAALVAVPLLVAPGGRRADRHLDPPGMVLAAVTLGAAVFAVIDLGHHGVRPPSVVALLVAAGAAIGLAVQERRAPEPMLPLDLLRRPFAGPNLAARAMNLVFNGFLFVHLSEKAVDPPGGARPDLDILPQPSNDCLRRLGGRRRGTRPQNDSNRPDR